MSSRQRRRMSLLWSIVAFLFTYTSGRAQFLKPDVAMPSPNAASLGLYGEVPVSLYTGTPNIDIPIYTVEEGKIQVPISLSYHASGVRVNQHPGWVGLNWNLNAGGAITRVIKGGNDESSFLGSGSKKAGYYYRDWVLAPGNWNIPAGGVALLESKLAGGTVQFDSEPDEFDFNFLGYSGRFYRNHSGGWQVASDADIKVQNTTMLGIPSGMDKGAAAQETFGGFIMTTSDGMKYYFGGSTASIEYTTSFFEQKIDFWLANTWHLTKIEAPEGYSVTFTYAPQTEGKFIASFSNSFQSGTTRVNVPWNQSTAIYSSVMKYSGTLIRPVYLSKIAFSKGSVDFSRLNTTELKYPNRLMESFVDFITSAEGQTDFSGVKWLDDALVHLESGGHFGWPSNLKDQASIMIDRLVWQKLTNISVKQTDNVAIQSVDFNYNDDANARLMLNGLSFKSGDCKNNYGFTYHNSSSLPGYFDEYDKTDHWGFYNNNSAFKYADVASNVANYFDHKQSSADINVLNAGSLEKITYPTSGFTKFVYEPHTIYKYKIVNSDGSFGLANAGNQKVGGIRIKEIEHNDGANSTKKTYSYTWQSGSSGIGSGLHLYNLNSVQSYYNKDGSYLGNYTKDIFSVNNTLPMSPNSLGSHIGYRQVKETNSDGSYSIYKYTNFESEDGGHMDDYIPTSNKFGSGGNIYDPQIDKSVERGKLLAQEDYDGTGIVSKKTVTYKKISDGFIRSVRANSYQFAVGSNNPIQGFYFMPYGYHAYQYRTDSIKHDIYDMDNRDRFVRDVEAYAYNGIGLPTQVESNRDSQKSKIINKYVYDYAMPTAPIDEYASSIHAMKGLGMNAVLVEQQIWNNENGTYKMIDGNINIFRRYNAQAGFNNVKVEKTYRFASTTLETEVGLSETNNGLFTYNSKYSNLIVDFGSDNGAGYTANGEPKQFKGSDGIWTYFNWYDGNKKGLLQSKKVGNQETTFEYSNPLVGVSKVNDLNLGTFNEYTYDAFNRLETVKDYNGNLLQSYTYNLKNSSGCDAQAKLVSSEIVDPVPDTDEFCGAVTKVRFRWRGNDDNKRLIGAKIQGSDNGSTWTDLHVISDEGINDWMIYPLSNSVVYKHMRFVSGPDGYGELRELQFYSGDVKLSGTPFGSSPNFATNPWQNAFDGDAGSMWHGTNKGTTNFVGLSLGCATTCVRPDIYKTAGTEVCSSSSQPKTVTLLASGCQGNVNWYRNGTLISSVTASTYTTNEPGTYTAKCSSGSCTSEASSALVVTLASGCDPTNGNQCTANLVKLLWRNSDGNRLAGATIQGSQNGVDWEVLYQFPTTAVAPVGSYVTQSFNNPNKYPHIRYNARANDGVGDLKEIRFYYVANGIEYPLTGTGFGSEPNLAGQGWANALDGNESTQWHAQYVAPLGHAGNSNFVGISLPCATTLITPILYKSTNGDVCANDSPITLTASGFSGQLEWYLNDVLIANPDQDKTKFIATIAGTYKVRSKSNSSYSGFSNTIVLNQKSGCVNDNQCTANLVKLLWRNSDGNRLAGATIQGSQNGVDWEVLYQFPTTAVAPVGSYVTQSFNNPNKYPHIRYNARANDGVGDLKEIRFYYVANGIEYPLTGTGFGSEPNLAGQGWANALDGNESTQWHAQYVAPLGHAGNSNFVGISLPCATTLITPILYKSTNGDVCANDSPITLTASGFSGQLEWYLNDVLIANPDQDKTKFIATIAGTYKVRSKSNSSYSGFSNTIVLNQKSGCVNDNQCTANLVKLLWRNSDGNRLAGATIQGSQNGVDWEVLYQFPTTAVAPVGSYVTQSFNNPNKYPHIRYNARANDGVGDLKEIRFYYVANGIEYPLTGTGFGSEPNLAGQGWANALDGNESTQWHAQYVAPLGHAGNSNFVGISLPCATTLITPTLYKSTNGDVCANDSPITLTASGFSGQLEWYLNDVLITTDPGQTQYTATIAGTYKVRSKSNSSYSGFSNTIVLNQKAGCAPPNYSRVVIVGNSITKLIAQTGSDGWQSPALSAAGGWGRASSTQAKDFAHILEARFKGLDPNAQVLPLWEAPFERDYVSSSHAGWVTYDFTALQNRIKNSFGSSSWKPDLVIIRLGENVLNNEVDLNNFKGGYNTLINKVLEVSAPGAKVILTNSMWADQPKANEKIQQVATERGLPFVDLSDMISNPVYLAGNDPVSMAAFPNNTGDKHPGDAGMLEIADRIWSKVRNVNLPSNVGGNITKVRLSPRTECCIERIAGSVIQGSNDISNANGWTTLAEIKDPPVAGWNEYPIRTTTAWRYVRFLAGTNCYGELKELEFYNGNVKLTGAKFGSPSAYNNDPVNYGYAIAFDGQVTNSWHGTAPGPQNYAGLDLGTSCPSPTARVLSPANNASVVGTVSPGTPTSVITAISVTTCVPPGTSITSVEIWARTTSNTWPQKMGNAIVDASQPGVYKLLAEEGPADGKWLKGYLSPGTYRFWARVNTTTGTFENYEAYNQITMTAPPGTGCASPTASVLSPANNASVVGTVSPGTPTSVITAISVTTCVPPGTSITSVEIWARTTSNTWPQKMGNAIVDVSQPGIYKLLAEEGPADGKWLKGYLSPGTYRFWAKVNTTTGTFENYEAYNQITMTAPPGTGCASPTASVLSPANNASVVGTVSPGTPTSVITAISVTTCVPPGTSITSVEIWARTTSNTWPQKMGNAIVDASQPGVYKLLAEEGPADGKWLKGYLSPGTYRFWARVNTTTGTFENYEAYNQITMTAPPGTGCASPTASVLSPANNASVVGTVSPGTPTSVITAISVTTCVPPGTSITSVEIWARTTSNTWPQKMGNAIVDASQPGIYKLLAEEGPADGKWLKGYLSPGTYRFWARVNTTTGTFENYEAYNEITLTAP